MQAIIILFAIASVPLLMWLMVRQRRKVDLQMRELRVRREEEARKLAPGAPFEEVTRRADGLCYGHRSDPAEEMSPAPDETGGEIHGVRGLQGRR